MKILLLALFLIGCQTNPTPDKVTVEPIYNQLKVEVKPEYSEVLSFDRHSCQFNFAEGERVEKNHYLFSCFNYGYFDPESSYKSLYDGYYYLNNNQVHYYSHALRIEAYVDAGSQVNFPVGLKTSLEDKQANHYGDILLKKKIPDYETGGYHLIFTTESNKQLDPNEYLIKVNTGTYYIPKEYIYSKDKDFYVCHDNDKLSVTEVSEDIYQIEGYDQALELVACDCLD